MQFLQYSLDKNIKKQKTYAFIYIHMQHSTQDLFSFLDRAHFDVFLATYTRSPASAHTHTHTPRLIVVAVDS